MQALKRTFFNDSFIVKSGKGFFFSVIAWLGFSNEHIMLSLVFAF